MQWGAAPSAAGTLGACHICIGAVLVLRACAHSACATSYVCLTGGILVKCVNQHNHEVQGTAALPCCQCMQASTTHDMARLNQRSSTDLALAAQSCTRPPSDPRAH
jgi:hypothetical protein